MTTHLYHHPIFLEHLTGPGHPERPDRLAAVDQALTHEAFQNLIRVEAPIGSEDAILLAHPEGHLEAVRAGIPRDGTDTLYRFDEDTVASPKSWEAALRAIGAGISAVDAVMSGEMDNAFIAARPPGHHAEKTRAMGFCFFNTAAIAALHALEKHSADRVAVIDFDVHHGNGTQDIAWDNPNFLYCSTHQMPLYPGTGAKDETGAHGNIVNAPLSAGDDGDAFRAAFNERVLPALVDFKPDLMIISAGFDAHHRDPLSSINLVEDDFDWATGKLLDVSGALCNHRVVSFLEGGYDLIGLAASSATHIRRMMEG
ncbi:histone deacetylase family protein [Notoacmeibacter sp. MSK16QG-6]|uniref:histone deacetylase family protein n=1 Tax=Notoacmeibacter sp. MSK16QG-6 TaxID=2957982 RepID=UPI00209D78C3|nr:histone deacetylase family protein [Notoacmeibacter sp. MSK16QG-6]MCP1198233.1 histone deacetylase family protein [Notoacmeibacter sp. MSK16QG-6]